MIARASAISLTGVYNLIAKVRAGGTLVDAERALFTVATCGVLRDLHDELDALVAEAHGSSWPADAVGQIGPLRQVAAAPRAIVARHLDTLAMVGELHRAPDGRYAVPVGAY